MYTEYTRIYKQKKKSERKEKRLVRIPTDHPVYGAQFISESKVMAVGFALHVYHPTRRPAYELTPLASLIYASLTHPPFEAFFTVHASLFPNNNRNIIFIMDQVFLIIHSS